MSVLMEFAMFPTDKGDSVSEYVSKVISMIRDSGFSYQLTAMGTLVETETMAEALNIVEKSEEILSQNSHRIYSSIKLDIQKNKSGRIKKKVESIESKIGKTNI